MKWILKLVVSGLAVLLTSYLLKGVSVNSFPYALLVALVLSLLNMTLKPILVVFTLPATILTLGVFMFVINALVIMAADYILPGFTVASFWWALLFSIILSIINSVFSKILKEDKPEKNRTVLLDKDGNIIE